MRFLLLVSLLVAGCAHKKPAQAPAAPAAAAAPAEAAPTSTSAPAKAMAPDSKSKKTSGDPCEGGQ